MKWVLASISPLCVPSRMMKSEFKYATSLCSVNLNYLASTFPAYCVRKNKGKCLLRCSRKKKPFLGYKNKNFKNSKNWHFSEGVNPWFWSKNGHFSNFCFRKKYRPGKCLLRYSKTIKRLSKLYKQEVQKVEKLTFFQKS